MLKPQAKKINSLCSNSIFFACNANFQHLSNSDAPADVSRLIHMLAEWAFDPQIKAEVIGNLRIAGVYAEYINLSASRVVGMEGVEVLKVNKMWIPVFLLPAVVLFLVIYAVPLGMVFGTSLFDYRLNAQEMTFIGFQNYARLLKDPDFFKALSNTVIWILIQCIVHVALGTVIALILYKKPKGWKFVRTAYMVPNIISNAAIAMIFLNIFNPQFGVINSFLKAVGLESLTRNWLMDGKTAFASVTMIWVLFAGYTTTLVLAQALSIDESVLEAAKVDGATPFQMDIYVVLPLLKKIIGTTMVMAATYMLQMFDLIYITTNGGPGKMTTNLPLLLYGVYKGENNYGYANTIGVFIVIIGVVVMTIINKVLRVNEEDY